MGLHQRCRHRASLLGEFGTGNNGADIQNTAPGSQGQWFSALVWLYQEQPADQLDLLGPHLTAIAPRSEVGR